MGRISCVVRGCHSRTGEKITMFGLPKDPVRLQLWLESCNRIDLIGKITDVSQKNYKLCELHFEEKFFSKGGDSKHLFQLALPTIFPWLKRKGHILLNDPPTKIVIQSDTTLLKQQGRSSQAAAIHTSDHDASPLLDTTPLQQPGHSSQVAAIRTSDCDASPLLDTTPLQQPGHSSQAAAIRTSDRDASPLLDPVQLQQPGHTSQAAAIHTSDHDASPLLDNQTFKMDVRGEDTKLNVDESNYFISCSTIEEMTF